MTINAIKFGTDGWRGIIAEDFTFDNVRLCSQAVAEYLKQNNLSKYGLVIGYDTRFASEHFAAAAAEVIASNNITVHLCSTFAPTPVVSFSVLNTHSAGAIIITASHNPASWNGFKYKTQQGASAPSEIISQIEQNIHQLNTGKLKSSTQKFTINEAQERGLLNYLNPVPDYFKQLFQLVDITELRQHKLKVIVDSMFGAGSGYFKEILGGGEIEVKEINGERNPSFPGINPEPITKNLGKLSNFVVEQKADIGLATDGDSDRIGIIDENGNFLNQHQVFALLSLYLLEIRGQRGAIIKTITSTEMVSKLGKMFHIPVYETSVGFKYVAPLMLQKDAIIGGEESGGYGFRHHVPERDAILAGLYFLDLMIKTEKTPSQLLAYLYEKVGPHYYDRIDLHISEDKRETIIHKLINIQTDTIAGIKVTNIKTADGFLFQLANESWLLIRFSGTEPLVRIYAEAESTEKVGELLNEGKQLIEL
jgi:alpha-D-glucose phosphate-specific phosphoglucomutase